MDRKVEYFFVVWRKRLDPDRNKREKKTLLFKAFVVLGLVFEYQNFSNTQIAIEADLVFVLHWRRLFLRQETKINALSRAANKFGEKIEKFRVHKLSRISQYRIFRVLNFRELGQNSRNSRKFLLAKVSAPKVALMETNFVFKEIMNYIRPILNPMKEDYIII